MPSRLDPGVAIVAADDLVGHEALVLLGQRIVVAAADQALDREEGVLGVGDRLALGGWPTSRSPLSVKATIEGVVRAPSAFSMTLALPCLP